MDPLERTLRQTLEPDYAGECFHLTMKARRTKFILLLQTIRLDLLFC